MKTPYRDEPIGGGIKRAYWTRDMAIQARRAMRQEMEHSLVRKGKRYNAADRKKALADKWGEYCESQRSVEEGQSLLREHPGIDRQENDFARRKG